MSNRDRLIAAGLGALVIAVKLPTLATPYYWDEVLWIGLAHRLAGLPLWQVLPGAHPPGLFAGRPPGLYLLAAALFELSGPSIWLSHLVIAAFAALGVAFTYLLAALLYGRTAGLLAALILALSPMYFAQAGMFLADLPVAACGVASVYWMLRRRCLPYLLVAIPLVLLKETALAIVSAITLYAILRERPRSIASALPTTLPWAVPLLVMAPYYAAQKLTSGSLFVQFEGFDLFQLDQAAHQFGLVTRWLFTEQLHWILTALVAANLILNRSARRRPELLLFGLIAVCAGYAFSVLYFLPRYLLPVAPYLVVLAAGALVELFPRPALHWTLGGALIALLALHLSGSERPGTREWDLGYLAAVRTYAMTAERLERMPAGTRILTAWPLSACLRQPELGYVARPLQAYRQREVAPLGSDDRFDAVVDASLGDGDPAALIAYAQTRGLVLIDRIIQGSFRCDVYGGDAAGAQPTASTSSSR